MYKVTKIIDFCYGHRLRDYDGKCRWLHGHNGRVEIDVAADTLDGRGMVVDFSELKREVGTWIDANLDHRMILRADDPAVPGLRAAGEPVYVIEDNPTAEALARLIYGQVAQRGYPVIEVRLWETPTSFATYREKN